MNDPSPSKEPGASGSPPERHSALSTQHSALSTVYSVLAVALVAALVGWGAWAWNHPAARGRVAVREAETLLREGRYTYAVARLERTLLTYSSPQLRLDLSYAYLARRDGERAERQARIALEGAPPALKPAAYAQLGRVLRFLGRDDEAIEAWDAARQKAAPYANSPPIEAQARSATWHAAMLHWERGDYTAARRELDALVGGSGIYAASSQLRLAQLGASTESNTSLALLDAAEKSFTQLNSALRTPHSALDVGVPGLAEGLEPQQALSQIAALRETQVRVADATEEGASSGSIAAVWGDYYLREGESGLAGDYLRRAISLEPGFADAHARLATLLLDRGEADGALQHLREAVRLSPQQPLAHHILARLYTQRGEWEAAEAELNTLRRLDPNSVELRLQVAEYHRLRGEYDEAEGAYIDAMAAQMVALPQDGGGGGGGADAALTLARFYTDVRGLGCEKGLPAARNAVALNPGDPAGLDVVGWALVQCSRADEALPPLKQAIGLAPGVPRYHYHLAKAYALLGLYKEARDQYAWVIDLDPTGPWERLAKSELPQLPDE